MIFQRIEITIESRLISIESEPIKVVVLLFVVVVVVVFLVDFVATVVIVVIIVGPRKLTLKFSQNRVSYN